jgi:hypothetical protein
VAQDIDSERDIKEAMDDPKSEIGACVIAEIK